MPKAKANRKQSKMTGNNNKLWAPWRVKYVQAKAKKNCIFCDAGNGKEKNSVVFTTRDSVCLLNIFPYNNGHLMVAPKKHIRYFSSLNDKQMLDLFRSVERAQALLKKALKPHGFNMGINFSDIAGAGIPGHMHVHIVPRWKGDTNFMPVVCNTKVISQSLCELHKILRHADTTTNTRV